MRKLAPVLVLAAWLIPAATAFAGDNGEGLYGATDDKILCVPLTDPGWNTLETLDEVSDQLQNEIANFFTIYKQLENKKVEVDGWYPCEDALEVIEASRDRFRNGSEKPH